MRRFGSIPTYFWEMPVIRGASDQAKLMAAYLMTGPHSNMLGCYRLPALYVTEDLQWDLAKVNQAFTELVNINFISRDDELSWLLIHDFLKDNKIQNSKQGISIQKLFDSVPRQSTIMNALISELLTYGSYLRAEFIKSISGYPIDTLSSVVRIEQEQNQDQDQDQKQEQDVALGCASTILPLSFLSFKTNQSNIKKDKYYSEAMEILDFLNEKANKAYEPTAENLNPIIDRLMLGESAATCRQIIVRKSDQWLGHKTMDSNLNSQTLFGEKFSRYKGELVLPMKGQSDEAR